MLIGREDKEESSWEAHISGGEYIAGWPRYILYIAKSMGLDLERNNRGLIGREDGEESCFETHTRAGESKELLQVGGRAG